MKKNFQEHHLEGNSVNTLGFDIDRFSELQVWPCLLRSRVHWIEWTCRVVLKIYSDSTEEVDLDILFFIGYMFERNAQLQTLYESFSREGLFVYLIEARIRNFIFTPVLASSSNCTVLIHVDWLFNIKGVRGERERYPTLNLLSAMLENEIIRGSTSSCYTFHPRFKDNLSWCQSK